MDEYSTSLPSATTPGKMWKRFCYQLDVKNPLVIKKGSEQWIVGQYYEVDDPTQIGIRWYEVELRHGPKPAVYNAPDWSNYARWKRDRDLDRAGASK